MLPDWIAVRWFADFRERLDSPQALNRGIHEIPDLIVLHRRCRGFQLLRRQMESPAHASRDSRHSLPTVDKPRHSR